MRMRKRKWVEPYLENEGRYLIRNTEMKGHWLTMPYTCLCLEIGMGMGDFLIGSARLNPNTLFIGFEKDETCVAKAIRKATDADVENIWIIRDDATKLTEYFDDGEVDVLYLQFSDPWPKKAHHKRRLTYSSFIALYDKVLKEKGEIVFKTDNKDLYEFSLVSFAESSFKLVECSVDYHRVPREDICTEYESKFVNEGLPIYYARFRKGS